MIRGPDRRRHSRRLALRKWRSFRRQARRARHRQCELRHAPALDNPVRDATAVSVMLKDAGFQVVETRAISTTCAMRRAVRDFSVMAHDDDVAVVFYAGHGLEVDGVNYLIPTARQARARHRRRGRSDRARSRPPHARAGAQPAAGDPRRLPRQSLRADHEAHAPRSRVQQAPENRPHSQKLSRSARSRHLLAYFQLTSEGTYSSAPTCGTEGGLFVTASRTLSGSGRPGIAVKSETAPDHSVSDEGHCTEMKELSAEWLNEKSSETHFPAY